MLGVRRDADHGVLAQPRAQAIDQRHLDGRGCVLRQQPEIAAGQRHRPFARQHDRLHRRRQRHAGETFAQYAGEMRRGARRRTERKGHRGGRQAALAQVTFVREGQLQAGDAQSTGGEPGREFLHEAVDAEAERFGVVHGRGQVELGSAKRGGGTKGGRGSATRPRTRSMMRTSSSPPRRASPSRGSAAACPNVVMPAFASVVRSASSRSTSVNGNGASSPGSCATDVTGCVRPARARSSAAPGVGANPSRAMYPRSCAPALKSRRELRQAAEQAQAAADLGDDGVRVAPAPRWA